MNQRARLVVAVALVLLLPTIADAQIKHRFVNPHPDGPDATVTRPSNWNDAHILSGGVQGSLLMRDTSQADGWSWVGVPVDDSLLVGNGTTWQNKTIPDCAGANQAITYSIATNLFGCVTITAGGGSGSVTSAGLAAPVQEFAVSGSPVTTSGVITLARQPVNVVGSVSGTVQIDWNAGIIQTMTVSGSTTLTLANPINGQTTYKLIFVNTGSFTMAWPASVRWPGGTTPAINIGAGAVTEVTLSFDGTNYTALMNTTGATGSGGGGGGGGALDGVYVTNSANQTLANNTELSLLWDTERYDDGGLHSTSATTDRLTAVRAGHYTGVCTAQFSAEANGSRWLYIKLNGTTLIGIVSLPALASGASGMLMLQATGNAKMAIGDYLVCIAFQDSGAGMSVNSTYSSFSMHGGGN